MSKHTPGPWKLDERVDTYVIGGHDGRRGICSTGGYSNNSVDPTDLNDENRANARLIAAAPLLLDMMRKIRDCIESDATYAQTLLRINTLADQAIKRTEEKQ